MMRYFNEFENDSKKIKENVQKISPSSKDLLKKMMKIIRSSGLTANEIKSVLFIANDMTKHNALDKEKAFCDRRTEGK